MFDVNHVSNLLKEARIRKNLTQSSLADKLNVTYQAVSNWERGTSLPDIANLSKLCEVLDLDLYRLVGASQGPDLAEDLLSNPDTVQDASIDSIAAVAPMMPPDMLMEAVRAKKNDIRSLSVLVQLAPFIDASLIKELGENLAPSHIAEVIELAPYVSGELCVKWTEALQRTDDFSLDAGLLAALCPYLPQEKLDELSEYVIPDNLVVLTSVAPFLSSDALCRLADRLDHITPDDFLVGMEGLLPFMGRDMMEKLHKKVTDH